MAYMLSMTTVGDLVDAIEAEQKRLGRDITNAELNELVLRMARENKVKVLSVSDERPDIDLLAGNLREDGMKVVNINEHLKRQEDK